MQDGYMPTNDLVNIVCCVNGLLSPATNCMRTCEQLQSKQYYQKQIHHCHHEYSLADHNYLDIQRNKLLWLDANNCLCLVREKITHQTDFVSVEMFIKYYCSTVCITEICRHYIMKAFKLINNIYKYQYEILLDIFVPNFNENVPHINCNFISSGHTCMNVQLYAKWSSLHNIRRHSH
jgi:hypothetical protein